MADESSGKELLTKLYSSLPALDILISQPPVNELARVDHTLHGSQPNLLFFNERIEECV